MGKVIAFPTTYTNERAPLSEEKLTLLQKTGHFIRLRKRQQSMEQSPFSASPAQRRLNRLSAEVLEVRIDRAVQDLQRPPAEHEEAQNNIQTLFGLADASPTDTALLEEAALYVASAYWDGDHVTTEEVAPLLQARADAAKRSETGGATVDMIHAVVTQHVVGCYTDDRLQQIEQFGLLEYFDHPNNDPDFPPVA